jgi:hypothetical protein
MIVLFASSGCFPPRINREQMIEKSPELRKFYAMFPDARYSIGEYGGWGTGWVLISWEIVFGRYEVSCFVDIKEIQRGKVIELSPARIEVNEFLPVRIDENGKVVSAGFNGVGGTFDGTKLLNIENLDQLFDAVGLEPIKDQPISGINRITEISGSYWSNSKR